MEMHSKHFIIFNINVGNIIKYQLTLYLFNLLCKQSEINIML